MSDNLLREQAQEDFVRKVSSCLNQGEEAPFIFGYDSPLFRTALEQK